MEIEFNEDGSIKLPEKIRKQRAEEGLKEEIHEFIENCWETTDFNLKEFIENRSYLGAFRSKRNWYFAYSHTNYYLVSTGIRELMRFNILLKEEVIEIFKLIKEYFRTYFTIYDLMDFLAIKLLVSERLNFLKETHLEDAHRNDFYHVLLQICYVLTITGDLVFGKSGRKVVFAIGSGEKTIDTPDIYDAVKLVGKTSKSSLIFKNNKFYFDIRCKNFRGSILPYLVGEIEYMKNLVAEYAPDEALDVEEVMENMEYEQRFHDIYQMVIAKNIRTDRDKFDHFVTRVKSALRIIGTITNLVEIEKEGKGNIFLRRRDSDEEPEKYVEEEVTYKERFYLIFQKAKTDVYFEYFAYLIENKLKNGVSTKNIFFLAKDLQIPSDISLKRMLEPHYGGSLVKELFGE
ncbi:MAG: hypothetical protein ABIA56_05170 [Actinomycetota bacterium]